MDDERIKFTLNLWVGHARYSRKHGRSIKKILPDRSAFLNGEAAGIMIMCRAIKGFSTGAREINRRKRLYGAAA
jgi:hypothetical protein